MATFDEHRQRLTVWKRALLAPAALAVFMAPYLFQRQSPALFWTALVSLALFVAWSLVRVAWHYWVLAGEP